MNVNVEKQIEEVVEFAEVNYGDGEKVRERIQQLLSQGLDLEEAIEKTSWEFYQ